MNSSMERRLEMVIDVPSKDNSTCLLLSVIPNSLIHTEGRDSLYVQDPFDAVPPGVLIIILAERVSIFIIQT
ncbi:MAG: hypothetical protein IIX08_01785, partial [Bacteroidales bacterium]|nr:hypothetical protein [Bacteroidales bacterium]